MTEIELKRRLLEIVTSVTLEDADSDFLNAAGALLALAISRLPPHEREFILMAIEEGGLLRREVMKFPGTPMPPEVPYGTIH
jgi:hypothetical protein